MGRLPSAESLLTEALGLKLEAVGQLHPSYATTLDHLALVRGALGDFSGAEECFRRALRIRSKVFPEDGPEVARTLGNLGSSLRAMGRHGEAEPLLRQAVRLLRTTGAADDSIRAESLHNLALLCLERNDCAEAEALLQEALGIWRATRGERHPPFTASLNGLAIVRMATGDYAAAEALFSRALTIRQAVLGEAHPAGLGVMLNLVGLYAATDRTGEAWALMRQVGTIEDKRIAQVLSLLSEDQRLAYLAQVRGTLDVALSLILGGVSGDPEATEAALSLVLRRKGIAAEVSAVQRDTVLTGRYPELEPKLRDLRALRVQIARHALQGPGPHGEAAYQRVMAELTDRKERLEKELARQIPEMELQRMFLASGWKAIVQVLPEDSALVEFIRFTPVDFEASTALGAPARKPPRYLAFVVRSGEPGSLRMIDLGEADAIDRAIVSLRSALDPNSRAAGGPEQTSGGASVQPEVEAGDGTDLRCRLLDPLQDALGNRSHLFLAPDGSLNRLPFEVIPLGEGRHLIDERRLSYLSTGRDALRFGMMPVAPAAPPLVVADPDFDLRGPARQPVSRLPRLLFGELQFGRLESTRREGEEVAAMLGVGAWLGGEALEGGLKRHPSPPILHVATHGFFLEASGAGFSAGWTGPEWIHGQVDATREADWRPAAGVSPMLCSGMALAGANTWLRGGTPPEEAEDGILTAEDVLGMDLLATELVVLSACETGLGRIQTGEGVLGLRRSFVLAGARALVISLWQVPDESTTELMLDLYRRLLDGQPRAEALRQAQLALKARYPSAFYWGAFIFQGDPGPLPEWLTCAPAASTHPLEAA